MDITLFMRCEVLSAAHEKITGFKHITLCSLVGTNAAEECAASVQVNYSENRDR
jgi:hypothetical protein